jgi:predicted Rossmann fold nucleotide-binding protein DprA/Smf involved in DNA uptake
MAPGVVAVAGSRSLPLSFAPQVQAVVASVVGSGRLVAVGCCVGADAFALSSGVPLSALRCFAAFGPGGVGSGPASAVSQVSAFAAAGGVVSWWSGGPASAPLRSRLAARTRVVICSASVSCVVFFSSPASRGSLLACRLAVARGLPVFAFPCGFAGSALPSLGAGSWVAVGGSGVWSSSFRWVSGQFFLF